MKENKVLDLFCGAGGLSLGFELAGYKIVGGVDFQKDAIETHEANFKDSTSICGDITQISNEQIIDMFGNGKVDVIIGGPPCQGFSAGNRQQKLEDDPRNKLFFEFIRFVKVLQPKAVVIENVRQILTKNDGFARKSILKILDDLGYNVEVRVLNSSEYGVPQVRNRAVFIGIKKEIGNVNYDKIKKISKKVTVEEAIGELYDIEGSEGEEYFIKKEPQTAFQKYVRATDSKITEHVMKYPNEKVQKRMSFVPEGGNWRDVPEELWDTKRDNRHSSAYKRLDSKEPSITIDTGHMNYFHPIYNRVPTVRESARLQSFPDRFVFKGTPTSQLRQVGNAVPPLMAKAVAELIKEDLKNEENSN